MPHRNVYSATGSSVTELYEQLGTMPDTVELESYDISWNEQDRLVITLRFADFD